MKSAIMVSLFASFAKNCRAYNLTPSGLLLNGEVGSQVRYLCSPCEC